jgi:hypothetical protein
LKEKKIHNIDSLEKEILRLQLKAKESERKLEKQFEKLKSNFGSMVLRSFRKKKEETERSASFVDSVLGNEKVNSAVTSLGEKVAAKLSGSLERLVDRLFGKSKS